jgi:hypothetical protein
MEYSMVRKFEMALLSKEPVECTRFDGAKYIVWNDHHTSAEFEPYIPFPMNADDLGYDSPPNTMNVEAVGDWLVKYPQWGIYVPGKTANKKANTDDMEFSVVKDDDLGKYLWFNDRTAPAVYDRSLSWDSEWETGGFQSSIEPDGEVFPYNGYIPQGTYVHNMSAMKGRLGQDGGRTQGNFLRSRVQFSDNSDRVVAGANGCLLVIGDDTTAVYDCETLQRLR